MKAIKLLAFSAISLFSAVLFAAEKAPLVERPQVQAFIKKMVKEHSYNEADLTNLFKEASLQPSIIESISRPAEGLPWYKYRKIFLKDNRIQAGVKFWHEHKETLQKASQEYGVPEEIIIAILGVETFYGKYAGKDRVLDALITLAFDYPPRSKFFLSELEQFLLLSKEEKWDPTSVKGSYAGAMGQPQFISSSYRHYAVDFNKNGQRDLINSTDDSIGSIANYFRRFGWTTGLPVIAPAIAKGNIYQSAIAKKNSPRPTHTLANLKKLGVQPKSEAEFKQSPAKRKYALVALDEDEKAQSYWLATKNFYVITRYNHSSLYAMAVYELSEAIKTAYNSNNEGSAQKL